jgi:hypothetical protein
MLKGNTLPDGRAVKSLQRAILELSELEQVTVGVEPLEPALQRIVGIIEENPDSLDAIKREFIELVRACPPGTTEIVQFCMHRYRWEEVRRELERLIGASNDVRSLTVYRQALEAFDSNWGDRDIFTAYRP